MPAHRQRFDAFDFDGAAEILEGVPLPLGGGVVEDFRAQVAARRQEVATLNRELREAVRKNRLLDLMPSIERLLTLMPDHAYGKALAEKVQRRIVDGAAKCLGDHHYDQALRLLEQIAPHVRTPQAQQLHHQAAELAWLAWDLHNAPVVDATLVTVAERLRRLAPGDSRTVKLCTELQRRAQRAESQGRCEPLPWARSPRQSPLGVSIAWLTGFERVGCAEALAQPDLLRYPGRFAVACGLALTGIKRAVLPINLLSSQQRGVLGRVTHLMRSRSGRSAWGIDIGASGLKAVKLVWNEAKQRAVIEAATLIEHAKPLSHAANEAEERRLIKETLEAFVNSQKTKPEHVCLGLPGRMALCRPIELPPIESARVPKFIQFEAAYQFPVPLEQLAWDFQIFDGGPPGADAAAGSPNKEGRQALLIGVKHALTRRFLDGFHGLGVRVEVLQTDFVGLHNFLAYEHFPPPGEAPSGKACPVVAALDVGCDVTNIVVSSPYSLWHHSGGVAGQSFTRALVKEFSLGIAQAEQRKRAPESAGRLSDLYEAMSPVFEDLLREVQEALAAYAEAEPNRPIQHIFGLGGGFFLHGLFRYLRCGR